MMKTIKITILLIPAVIVAACGSSKKIAASAASPGPTVPAAPATTSTPFFLLPNPASGAPAPGNEDLTAIQQQYKDVTLDKLKQGHSIYTQGACVSCHGASNIYQIDATKWEEILEDMSVKANITEVEKDAVNKYVLAIKATQRK
jgi:mono/diheme cytochrome c family protein